MTIALNKATLLYQASARPQDLVRNLLVSADGNGTGYSGFAGVEDLAVKAQISKAGALGTITVKLQDSADGITYADVATVGALSSSLGEAIILAGVSPRNYVRAAWTTAGGTKHFSLSVSVVPVGIVPHT